MWDGGYGGWRRGGGGIGGQGGRRVSVGMGEEVVGAVGVRGERARWGWLVEDGNRGKGEWEGYLRARRRRMSDGTEASIFVIGDGK